MTYNFCKNQIFLLHNHRFKLLLLGGTHDEKTYKLLTKSETNIPMYEGHYLKYEEVIYQIYYFSLINVSA